jgi:hypothetical protein
MLGVRGAHEEPIRPGVEAVRITERGEVAPDVDERLLCRVLGAWTVPQDAVRDRVEPIHQVIGELVEGVLVAPLRLYHQLPLHDVGLELRSRMVPPVLYESAAVSVNRSSHAICGRSPGKY